MEYATAVHFHIIPDMRFELIDQIRDAIEATRSQDCCDLGADL